MITQIIIRTLEEVVPPGVDKIEFANFINQRRKSITMKNNSETKALDKVVQIDEARMRDYPGELVRGTVEDKIAEALSYYAYPQTH